MILILFAVQLGLLVYLGYKWISKKYRYFEKQGLPYMKPVPVLGWNSWILSKRHLSQVLEETYNAFPGEKIIGLFDFWNPFYFLCDPQLIRQVTTRDFDHFQNRRVFIDSKGDEFFGHMLPMMKGHRWREMRFSLSPAFTGSKMKLMFDLVTICSSDTTNFLLKDIKNSNDNDSKHYDMKELFGKYTTDVIATCAFGLKVDSFEDPDNEFCKFGQKFMDLQKPSQLVKFFLIRFLPKVAKTLNITLIDNDTKNKFYNVIIETMKTRRKNDIHRPDMVNLLMQLRRGQLGEMPEAPISGQDEIAAVDETASKSSKSKIFWTDNELISQCFVFFLAGFDTSSTLMAFTAYELAVNSEIQDRLIEEVDKTSESLNGETLSYEVIQNMKYLDMVIAEALRKWPPAPIVDRCCVKDYFYKDQNGLKFKVKKNQFMFIPIYALHRDPKHFPNPEKFDPERFNEQNKSRSLHAYFPFGIGPRNCIGSRFALMETKAIIYQILLKFRFEVGKDTPVPLLLKKGPIGLIPKDKIKLRLLPRNKN